MNVEIVTPKGVTPTKKKKGSATKRGIPKGDTAETENVTTIT
jgi:hypothetical protein